MPDPTLHVRAPRQDRSRATLDRISEAALERLAERGLDEVNVRDIVERAGSSVGSFYARFAGRDQLVRYLRVRVWEEAVVRWDEAKASGKWEHLDLRDRVREVVGVLVDLHRDAAGRGLLMDGSEDGNGAAGSVRGTEDPVRELHTRIMADLSELLLRRPGELEHPDPELAVVVGYRILIGAIREFLGGAPAVGSPAVGSAGGGTLGAGSTADASTTGVTGLLPLSRDRLVDELSRSFLNYLGGGGVPGESAAAERGTAASDEPRGPRDLVDPFDVWA